MFPIRDSSIREFCKDVIDVDYIAYTVNLSSAKRDISSEQQYIELMLLLSLNDSAKVRGQEPYVKLLTDDCGARYACLSDEGAKYALSHDFSFMPERKERDAKNVSLRKATSKYVDNTLEDKVCDKCGNVLGINCAESEYLRTVNTLINRTRKDSVHYNGKGNPWSDVFLKFKDIEGHYLN